jgi:guanylate kinase
MVRGIPFVVSAPSGAGKSTLIRELLRRVGGLVFSVSHTTRPARQGEVAGGDYHFVDRATFERMVEAGEFAEWAEVHGNLYGTTFSAIRGELEAGRDVVLDIDVQGALQIEQRLEGAVLIFVIPPSWEELLRRIESRASDAPEVIARRMANARKEFELLPRYRYVVVNENVEDAVADLAAIVRAERCSRPRWNAAVERLATG